MPSHKPVLLQETIRCLNLRPGLTVLDGTLGGGGHAQAIAQAIQPGGTLIALDQDPVALERAKEQLAAFSEICFYHENFRHAAGILEKLNIQFLNAVILDVGFSSDQLEDASRGFSFEREGPLDMRMNPEIEITAADLINRLPETELADLIYQYGEERMSRRFAASICRARREHRIETTTQLNEALVQALPYKLAPKGQRPPSRRHHPGTRVYQALRIAVNDELGALKDSLISLWPKMAPGGRMAVISFHSLEDRIVKNQFREWHQKKEGKLVMKKPIAPAREEVLTNSRSRSAKLRCVEKL